MNSQKFIDIVLIYPAEEDVMKPESEGFKIGKGMSQSNSSVRSGMILASRWILALSLGNTELPFRILSFLPPRVVDKILAMSNRKFPRKPMSISVCKIHTNCNMQMRTFGARRPSARLHPPGVVDWSSLRRVVLCLKMTQKSSRE